MPEAHVHARARDATLDVDMSETIAQTMQAVSTGSRVRLLYALREGEKGVTELAEIASVTAATASQQLRVLRHLNLVSSRRDGQSIRYRLHDDHVGVLLDEIRNHVEHAELGSGLTSGARRR